MCTKVLSGSLTVVLTLVLGEFAVNGGNFAVFMSYVH